MRYIQLSALALSHYAIMVVVAVATEEGEE
jgi:hypothetical protein